MAECRDPSMEITNEANRALVVQSGPIQPVINFKQSEIGKKLFKGFGTLVGTSEDTFTKSEYLAKHISSRMHMLSLERYERFVSGAITANVQINNAAQVHHSRQEKQRAEHCHIIIFDVLRHLGKQNSAFRGHRESENSKNKGNFLKELDFLSKYHEPLKKWMETHPGNPTCLSTSSYECPASRKNFMAARSLFFNTRASAITQVIEGQWYAVIWEASDYWFIGRAIKVTGNMVTLEFVHQTAPDVNTSKSTTDGDSVPFSDVFLHIDPPMPVSCSRCSSFGLQEENFQRVKDSSKDLCGL
eukprot:gene11449-12645_t